METFGLKHNINPSSGIWTSYPNSLSSSEEKFVQYLDTLIGSTNPQVRFLGCHTKAEYLKEKKKLELIPITPYNALLFKSCEVITRLRETLASGGNPDSGAIAQVKQEKDTLVRYYQEELSETNRIKYDRIISHLDRSTDFSSIENA